jgi:hypothetical protein
MIDVTPYLRTTRIAYLSMEIGLRPEMHTYSGGLGILAGDAARSAADLGLPMVFVTLASRSGYLHQDIDSQGAQIDSPDPWNPEDYTKALGVMTAVPIEGRTVWIRPWLYELKSPLGRQVPVILLDTNVNENDVRDRSITDRLYGGDEIDRIRQEIVLGIGGEKVLRALGFAISTYHLNEGHAAFLALSLLLRYRRERVLAGDESLSYAMEQVREQCVFTTHTPVEAGHDRYEYRDIRRVLGDIIELDRLKQLAGDDRLNMTNLALNLSGYVNGVALRHAQTAPGDDAEADEHRRRADQPELLRDHRVNEIGMRLGEVKQFLDAVHQAPAGHAARADRDQRLDDLKPVAERVVPGIEERQRPPPAIRRTHHHQVHGGQVGQRDPAKYGFSSNAFTRPFESTLITPNSPARSAGTTTHPTVRSAPFSMCRAIIGP